MKDKLSQLTIYKVSPLHLTHHVSSNPTNITLPPSSLSLFPSEFSNIRAPPPPLSSYYSTSSSSSSYDSNILALCGNISFQISFPNFKNYLSSQSSSSSYGFSLLSFIKSSLNIGIEQWMWPRRWFSTSRRLYMQMPVFDRVGLERNPDWLNRNSQSTSVVMCGQNLPTPTW